VCAVLQREAKQGELDAVTKLLQEKQFIRKGIVQAAEKWASAVGDTPRLASPFTITHHKNHTHALVKMLRTWSLGKRVCDACPCPSFAPSSSTPRSGSR
jgi:hypothetical protein